MGKLEKLTNVFSSYTSAHTRSLLHVVNSTCEVLQSFPLFVLLSYVLIENEMVKKLAIAQTMAWHV